MKQVTLQPYGSVVHFFNNEAQMKRALKRHDEDLVSGCRGITYTIDLDVRPPKQRRLYIIGVFDGSITTLVHETGHATLDEAQYRGFDPCSGNGEAFCYLQGYLFVKLLPHLKKKR